MAISETQMTACLVFGNKLATLDQGSHEVHQKVELFHSWMNQTLENVALPQGKRFLHSIDEVKIDRNMFETIIRIKYKINFKDFLSRSYRIIVTYYSYILYSYLKLMVISL